MDYLYNIPEIGNILSTLYTRLEFAAFYIGPSVNDMIRIYLYNVAICE